MKDILRQIAVLLTVLLTITINILANALPINGLNTGQIADRFQIYFVPAGYVFSIWSLIYLGLLAYAGFQALPAQRTNPRLQATGWWVLQANLANAVWIFLWHYQQFTGSLAAMLVLLASLIAANLRLGIRKTPTPAAEIWAVRVPFSLYLGWITVATVANATSLLDALGWDRFGVPDAVWMVVVLVVVLVIAAWMNFSRRDIVYASVLLWALAGIGVNFPQAGIVTVATWSAFGLVAVTLGVALIMKARKA